LAKTKNRVFDARWCVVVRAAIPSGTAEPNLEHPSEKNIFVATIRIFARDCAHAGGPVR
jgi:hypothetical protein